MDTTLTLPLDAIARDALPRDRSMLDPVRLAELQSSIAAQGLRQPIEVWKLSKPTADGRDYGLISGLRRLTAHHNLNQQHPDRFATIRAVLRQPANLAEAMEMMIAENEIRSDPSPWDKGRILIQSVQEHLFDTVEAAALALHPNATRQKRAALRHFAHVVDELDGQIATPQGLSARKMLQLSAALRGGLSDLIRQVLLEHRHHPLEGQWAALVPTLTEAARNDPEVPATRRRAARPRRLLRLHQGLVIRREWAKDGWRLCFSGPEARPGALMDDVMALAERMFEPGFGG